MDKRIGLGLVLALTLSLQACASGGSPDEGAAAKSAPKTPAPTATTPAKSKKPGVCAEESNGQTCTFGQVAQFTATAGSGPSKSIEITVAPPARFTPKDPSEVQGATQAENVNFSITLTNLSDTEAWDPTILTEVVSAAVDGAEIYTSGFRGLEVQPGKSVTVREAWSVKDADDIELTLDIDGLAGHSITFTP